MAPVYESPKKTPVWMYIVGGCCGCIAVYVIFSMVMGFGMFYVFGPRGHRGALDETRCKSNLTQIGAALEMYTADHDGYLPPAGSWCDALGGSGPKPYLSDRGLLRCRHGKDTSYYAMNDKYSGAKLADIKDPANTPLIYESTATTSNAHDAFASTPTPPRHTGGNNILFADLQVRTQP